MRRDTDYVRQLLFDFEADDDWVFHSTKDDDLGPKFDYHIRLMEDEGLIRFHGKYSFRMTAHGHDFLDAIRTEDIWDKTKKGAISVGGLTLGMMKDLAVAYLKKEAAEKLGVDL